VVTEQATQLRLYPVVALVEVEVEVLAQQLEQVVAVWQLAQPD
jgi:hypothetical protein